MWCELERARHTQQIIPMTRDELGVDAVACDAVQRPVVSGRVDAIEARVTKIRQAWAEAIAEQHEQAEDNVRIRSRVRHKRRWPQRGVLLEQAVQDDHRVAQGAWHDEAEEADAARGGV